MKLNHPLMLIINRAYGIIPSATGIKTAMQKIFKGHVYDFV